MELILPWAAEKPQQAERCEPVCLAEVFPVGGREAAQVNGCPDTEGGVTFFRKLQICCSDLGLPQQEEIHPHWEDMTD